MDILEYKLCDVQGRLFELFCDTEYDPKSLVKAFMNSNIARGLDSLYNRYQWAGEEYLLEELIDTCNDKLIVKKKDYSKDVMHWIGYVYRYWHYYLDAKSKDIYKIASFDTMNTNYLMFHTMAVELAIDDLIEIYNQRKQEKGAK